MMSIALDYVNAVYQTVGSNPMYYMIIGAMVVGLVGKAFHAVLYA